MQNLPIHAALPAIAIILALGGTAMAQEGPAPVPPAAEQGDTPPQPREPSGQAQDEDNVVEPPPPGSDGAGRGESAQPEAAPAQPPAQDMGN